MPIGADRVVRKVFGGIGVMDGVSGNAVDVSITGSFVATAQIQRLLKDGTWVAIESVTAPAQRVVENAVSRKVRVEVTAYTSGSIDVTLESGQ